MYTNQESGRSMVEMMGVLAVMGVLSVGGVAMYTSAMNKYKANELLNEANKRAVVVATQFAQGRETASLAEFSGHSSVVGGTFDDNTEITLNKKDQFSITIQNVSEHVCQYMKNALANEAIIRGFKPSYCSKNENSVILKYNKNLDVNDNTCSSSYSGEDCEIVCNSHGVISNNICLCDIGYIGNNCETLGETACETNEDCTNITLSSYAGKNTYCKIAADNNGGKCYSKGSLIPVILPSGTSMYTSVQKMTWWAAEQFCAAHGMKRASKNLFIGMNAPDTTNHTLWHIFKESGLSGNWYKLDEEESSTHSWEIRIFSHLEDIDTTSFSGEHAVLCIE